MKTGEGYLLDGCRAWTCELVATGIAEAQREVTGVNSRQAINLLKGLEQSLDDYCELNDEGKAAFRMAITALELFGNAEQLPSAQPEIRTQMSSANCISRQAALDCVTYDVEYTTECIKALPSLQPTCNQLATDTISRQEAIEAVFKDDRYTTIKQRLEALPSKQPERKKGCKIVKSTGHYGYCACDQCGKPVHPEDLFCSKCGADFREEDT